MLMNEIKASVSLAGWLAESSHAYGSDFNNFKMMGLFTSVVLERIQAQAYLNNNPRNSIKVQQGNGAFSTGE